MLVRATALWCVLTVSAVADDAVLKIIGGQPVPVEDFPFMTFVTLKNGFCSGSIIAPHWVLTAAHCIVEGDGSIIPASSVTVERGWPSDYEVRREIGRLIPHPDYYYQGAGFRNDIALVEILEPFESEHLFPAEVVTPDQELKIIPAAGAIATAVGYGRKENNEWSAGMRGVEIPVYLPEVCRDMFSISYEDEMAHDRTLCAGTEEKRINSGDSGGPLLIRTGTGWTQVGVASIRAAASYQLSIYTRVASVYDWIAEYTGLPNQDDPTDFTQSYFQIASAKCTGHPQNRPRCLLLPVIVQGGVWETEIEVRNWTTENTSRYDLVFRSDDPRGLHVNGVGWVRGITGELGPRGVHTYTLGSEHSKPTIQAEALVIYGSSDRFDPHAGSYVRALIMQYVPGRPLFQAVLYPRHLIPNHGFLHGYPYRNDGPYTTAMAFGSLLGRESDALANPESGRDLGSLHYYADAYDAMGNRICGGVYYPPGGDYEGSKSFLVEELLPCTEGQKGFIQFEPRGNLDSDVGHVTFQPLAFHDEGPFFAF